MENVCSCDAVVTGGWEGAEVTTTNHRQHSSGFQCIGFSIIYIFPSSERPGCFSLLLNVKTPSPLPLRIPLANISSKLNLNQFYAGNNGPKLMSSIIQILAVLTRRVWPKVVSLYFANIRRFLFRYFDIPHIFLIFNI